MDILGNENKCIPDYFNYLLKSESKINQRRFRLSSCDSGPPLSLQHSSKLRKAERPENMEKNQIQIQIIQMQIIQIVKQIIEIV